ncbi:hypothetical protein [Paraburkholderia fungorum]|uniref:Uncharacterized protein n=1 Tax=Paraburkholderia fungorum TaxID=134537 RepID=A0AAW3V3V1_9BURK|nr:hypothetical protein [Paraburkholderia fungorum]MBB4516526.1 hypothetical protein [Paraburkholderia fungorum]MBB5545216.1 hypothetical protein [Paraburkholderia fungorum]MBB6205001.1 hypothetical protein [Paraburkholderia fungorum]MDE1007292.1 hypothetical protein [Paraburkholderia fungorum]
MRFSGLTTRRHTKSYLLMAHRRDSDCGRLMVLKRASTPVYIDHA